jgi:RNA polymerase sigma factor (TIGR02999 family)
VGAIKTSPAGHLPMSEVTRILSAIELGDPHAAEQLLPLVYTELRRLAAERMAQEKPGQTLEATALVHEAYLRLVDVEKAQHWNSRSHFFAAAAEAMRRILIENARRKKRLKRGGALKRVDFNDPNLVYQSSDQELIALEDALEQLAAEAPDAAQLVRLRYFAGLSVAEAAEMVGIARTTAYEHWAYARAWLRCRLQGDDTPQS